MSNPAREWAWKQKCGSHAAKCVLVSLADHISKDGKCCPSFDRLIEHTELSRQGVTDQIHKLEKAGLVTVIRRNGAPNHYSLPVNGTDRSTAQTGQPQTSDQSTSDIKPVNGTDQNSKNIILTLPPKVEKKPKYQPSERGLSFADWFRTISPDIQLPETWRQIWAKCYDDMIRIDKRTPEAIALSDTIRNRPISPCWSWKSDTICSQPVPTEPGLIRPLYQTSSTPPNPASRPETA